MNTDYLTRIAELGTRKYFGASFLAALLFCHSALAQTKPLYENDFEKSAVGKVPEEMLVLDGGFAVKEENGNKVLELPGDPLDTFGVLFGPTESSNAVVSAKVLGTSKGRRFPTFGIGANGVGGYRLQVSPGKKLLELYKGDEAVKSVAYEWKSGEWTELRLQVSKVKDGEFKIEGKVWTKGGEEPKAWMVSHDDSSPAAAGRTSIWGSPYAGTPIQFDDLLVTRSEGK
jgi:hypothetical protein